MESSSNKSGLPLLFLIHLLSVCPDLVMHLFSVLASKYSYCCTVKEIFSVDTFYQKKKKKKPKIVSGAKIPAKKIITCYQTTENFVEKYIQDVGKTDSHSQISSSPCKSLSK